MFLNKSTQKPFIINNLHTLAFRLLVNLFVLCFVNIPLIEKKRFQIDNKWAQNFFCYNSAHVKSQKDTDSTRCSCTFCPLGTANADRHRHNRRRVIWGIEKIAWMPQGTRREFSQKILQKARPGRQNWISQNKWKRRARTAPCRLSNQPKRHTHEPDFRRDCSPSLSLAQWVWGRGGGVHLKSASTFSRTQRRTLQRLNTRKTFDSYHG